jgi:hypothetical protein
MLSFILHHYLARFEDDYFAQVFASHSTFSEAEKLMDSIRGFGRSLGRFRKIFVVKHNISIPWKYYYYLIKSIILKKSRLFTPQFWSLIRLLIEIVEVVDRARSIDLFFLSDRLRHLAGDVSPVINIFIIICLGLNWFLHSNLTFLWRWLELAWLIRNVPCFLIYHINYIVDFFFLSMFLRIKVQIFFWVSRLLIRLTRE